MSWLFSFLLGVIAPPADFSADFSANKALVNSLRTTLTGASGINHCSDTVVAEPMPSVFDDAATLFHLCRLAKHAFPSVLGMVGVPTTIPSDKVPVLAMEIIAAWKAYIPVFAAEYQRGIRQKLRGYNEAELLSLMSSARNDLAQISYAKRVTPQNFYGAFQGMLAMGQRMPWTM